MEHIIDLENASINSLLAERTIIHWQDIPEFSQILEPVNHLDEVPTIPTLTYLLKLVRLICQSDEEQSNKLFLLLESYCAIADPEIVSQVISCFIWEGSESYPPLATKATGWLAWALDYKPELERKGKMVKRLWRLTQWRGEDIAKLIIEKIVASFIKRQESRKDAANQGQQSLNQEIMGQDIDSYNRSYHSVLYLLQCGPLADQAPTLWHEESVLNTLIRLRDGGDPRMLENQQLILANLLDRIFLWMESKDYVECIEQLKERVAYYTKTPELLIFAMDAVLRYLDGRWSRSSIKEESVRSKTASLSLMEINQERSPIHYLSLDTPGPFGFPDGKAGTRGKSLKEREIPINQGRAEVDKEYEISDLVAQCLVGHEPDTIEQLLRSFRLHIEIKVDTILVSTASAVTKQPEQQRDKIRLRLIAENPVYKRIIASAMNQGLELPWLTASICLPLIQGMLKCTIAHWSTCKNISPQAYPKELEEATWVAQLAEHCYYVVLVKNADMLQQQQKHQSPQLEGPEISLIKKLIFKHARRTVHLMPLFVKTNQAQT
ncbi:hypothetical protein BGX27_001431 [Mortierella sp. AM989]|nr:hypothetical protein BGX27_001431 [Mortierella sp. AM989]